MGKNEFSPNTLIIDDERDIREGCERILYKMNCGVFSAGDGETGLKILEKEKINIVICDIKMPGMDGIEVLERIKEKDESILVIMITGFGTVENAIAAMKKGAYDFISKPFTLEQMRLVLNRAIEKLKLEEDARLLKLERKQNLADLGAEQSRLRTIVESLPNGVMVTNMSGQIVLINPMAKAFLGLPEDMENGRNISDFIQDKGLNDYLLQVSECSIDGRDKIGSYELVLSEERYVLVQGRPVTDDENNCLGAVVELSDISDLKLFDRLKSEFVAKVSHELRSPLSVIHEQLALVLKAKDRAVSENSQHILGRAKDKAHTLISMIGDLLDISKIEAGAQGRQLVKVRVDDLLQGIVDFLGVEVEKKKQTLEYEKPKNPVLPVLADPVALESVFGNLITNAIKYTPEKGMIKVSIDCVKKMLRVRVKDNGYGIDAAHQERIFEKFYRVKDEKTRFINGTGLGLPIAKALVEAFGGQISLISRPDKGSEFTVLLPAASE